MDSAPPPVPSPPPVLVAPAAVPARPAPSVVIVTWTAGVPRCALRTVTPVHLEPPLPAATSRYFDERANAAARSTPVTLSFAIDARGRPVSIKREPTGPAVTYMLLGDTSDLEPSLAASQFAPGIAQSECRLLYTPTITRIADATPELIARVLSSPLGRLAWRDVRQRWIDAGAICVAKPPRPLTVAFPDLATRKAAPGRWETAGYRFDIGANGVPTNIVSMLPEGATAPDIDAEIRRALSASRFAPEARTGCQIVQGFPPQVPLPPPERPPLPGFAVKGARCPFPASPLLKVEHVPFPEGFRRRNIEGWAVVRFDLAPWGASGNVSTLAAEPAAAFGVQATQLVTRAKMAAAPEGHSGCVAPISYRINADAGPAVIGADGVRVPGEDPGPPD